MNRIQNLDPRAWRIEGRIAAVAVLFALSASIHFYLHALLGGAVHALLFLPVTAGGLLMGYPGGLLAGAAAIAIDISLHGFSQSTIPEYIFKEAATGFVMLMAAGLGSGYINRAWAAMRAELKTRAETEEHLLAGQEIHQNLIQTAQRQAKERELLAQVHTALSREMDPQVIFRTVVESIAEAFHYRLVSVYKLAGDGLYLQHQVGYEQPVQYIPLTIGIVSRCVREARPLLVTDVDSEPGYIKVLEIVGSEVSVPLFSEGNVIGVLNIESERDKPLGEAELRMMTELGEYVNISLERARLYEAEREQRNLAESLHATARALNRSLELKDVLTSILANLDRVVPCEAAGMILIEPGGTRMLVRDRGIENARELPLPPGIGMAEIPALQHMAATGEPFIVSDVRNDPVFSRYRNMEWIGSVIGMPVQVKGQVPAFLILASSQSQFFTREHAAHLQIFVEQAGAAIENARLFDNAQRQARYLEVLNDITNLGVSATGVDEIFQGLAGHLAALIGADSAYLSRWDEARQIAVPIAANGLLQKTYAEIDVEPGEATVTAKVLELEQSLVVEDVQHSPFLSPRLAAHFPICSLLGLPLVADGRKLGAVLLAFEKRHVFSPEEIALCEQAAGQAALAISKVLLIGRIEQLAITDELTGLYNHRGLMELGRREVERALRFNRPLAAIMLDIDHFKNVNDRFGHPLGNQVLKVLAERCRSNIREIDIFCRYGGEEFVVLLPENNLAEGRVVAERLRTVISGLSIHTGQGDIRITVSLGVAEVDAGVQDLAELIEHTDQAMYRAKNAGRNCVVAWESQQRLLGTD